MKKKTKVKKTNAQWGLEVKSFPKNIQWAVDQDYISGLTPAALYYLGLFNQEYYRNRINKREFNLHDTKDLRKDCERKSNASRRDLFSIKNVGLAIVYENTAVGEDGLTISILNNISDINASLKA